MATLEERFDPRRNSLNALRLALALLVVVSHSWPLGGFGEDPGFGPTNNLGAWAVSGFFAISGYLITGSRLNSHGLADYLWRRFLRIYPAFLVVLVVVGFVFAPISMLFDDRASWTPASALHFLVNDLALYMRQYGVDGTLQHVPFANSWDGSLWTLAYEFACYLAIGLAVTFVGRRTGLLVAVTGFLLVTTTLALIDQALDLGGAQVFVFARLACFFAAGSLLYLLRRRVPVRPVLAAAAAGVLVVLAVAGRFDGLAALPLAYLLMHAGAALPLDRVGARNDISYGLYIYGFPVQQTVVLAVGAAHLSPLGLAGLATLVTVPLAWLSWLCVERPSMKWKRLTAERSAHAEAHLLRQA